MPLSLQNNVEFFLQSPSKGTVYIPEPVNYDNGNGNKYERDQDSKGFLTMSSNDLEFYGAGYEFLEDQFNTKGILEEVVMIKRVKSDDRLDERWKVVSRVSLDMTSLQFDDDRLKVQVSSSTGGLYKLLESSMDDEYDLKKKDDNYGNLISAIDRKSVLLEGRAILRISDLSVEDGTGINAFDSDGLTARSIPFKVDRNSDQEDVSNVFGDQLSADNGNYAALSFDKSANCFITNCDQSTRYLLNGRVEIRIVFNNHGTITLDLVRYGEGADQKFVEKVQLDTGDPNNPGEILAFDFVDYELEANKGDSFAIGVLTNSFPGVTFEVHNTSLEIREDSFYAPTRTEAITEKECVEQLVAIISGQENSVKSDLLDNSERLLTNGFWVRQFPDIVNEGTAEERRFQLKTSLKDFMEHLDTMSPIAWWTEWDGDREILRIEELRYTQQNFIGIRYGEVSESGFQYIRATEIKRSILQKNLYSKIVIGSTKGGADYEEVYGLQSVTGRGEWATVNDRNIAEYRKTSPYRLGDIDVELPRRKLFRDFPEEDTRFDDDIMVLDCKVIGGKYYLRTWEDEFDSLPTNIYKPESAYNLALTPRQLLLRHGYVINTALYFGPGQMTFSSSNCNSIFSYTKDGVTINDSDPILHSELERPKIKPIAYQFTLPVSQDLEDQIVGSQKGIKNWFGMVAVDTGDGIKYMRLVSADATKDGQHKLVEAFI